MKPFLLLRKDEDENEIPSSIPAHQTEVKRTLEFGRHDRLNKDLDCTIEVDKETFYRVKVGRFYEVKIEEVDG